MKVLITGGLGFIGSNLVDAVMPQGLNTCVLDNLSVGTFNNVKQWLKSSSFTFIRVDLLNLHDVTKASRDCDIVFHLAANPEVRTSSVMPHIHFEQNVVATYNLLEAIRKSRSTRTLVFTSSSTVYGEPSKIPTPEDYAPLMPISVHGSCKLACEALIIAYTNTYGFKSIIYRLANIVGSRSRHGVIYDFILKLKKNPARLEILGDGSQIKSYLHVSDCVEAMLLGLQKSKRHVEIFNVGSEDQVDVKTIAEVVTREMETEEVKFEFTGGVDGGRGWKGDVKNMLLDISKLKSLGWQPKHKGIQPIVKATHEIMNELSFKSN